ncbi:hypothetical protein BOX15_Mlig029805g1, partial [Macrostomum lignano]
HRQDCQIMLVHLAGFSKQPNASTSTVQPGSKGGGEATSLAEISQTHVFVAVLGAGLIVLLALALDSVFRRQRIACMRRCCHRPVSSPELEQQDSRQWYHPHQLRRQRQRDQQQQQQQQRCKWCGNGCISGNVSASGSGSHPGGYGGSAVELEPALNFAGGGGGHAAVAGSSPGSRRPIFVRRGGGAGSSSRFAGRPRTGQQDSVSAMDEVSTTMAPSYTSCMHPERTDL